MLEMSALRSHDPEHPRPTGVRSVRSRPAVSHVHSCGGRVHRSRATRAGCRRSLDRSRPCKAGASTVAADCPANRSHPRYHGGLSAVEIDDAPIHRSAAVPARRTRKVVPTPAVQPVSRLPALAFRATLRVEGLLLDYESRRASPPVPRGTRTLSRREPRRSRRGNRNQNFSRLRVVSPSRSWSARAPRRYNGEWRRLKVTMFQSPVRVRSTRRQFLSVNPAARS